ncbi:DUF6000 family protein [Roseibacillus persicicus]|uniref:DUF6000 family protein n=1 Tax=Roseibacillus persicicus TaxID=454148 RepID=UPI003CE50AF0
MNEPDFTAKWVLPFYRKIGRFRTNEDELVSSYLRVSSELTPQVVQTLFSEPNWRHRSTAAWFTAIRGWTDFEEEIIEYLLLCELCYEGGGFLLSLASLATPNSVRGVTNYLDRYLVERDPYGSQADGMHALKWLDLKNGTALFPKYEPRWIDFCAERSRPLDETRFFSNLRTIERIQKG